jgi:hypothetical protein
MNPAGANARRISSGRNHSTLPCNERRGATDIPVSASIAARKALKAASPLADAPIPTINCAKTPLVVSSY